MVKFGVGCVTEMPSCNSLWKLFVVQLAGSFLVVNSSYKNVNIVLPIRPVWLFINERTAF